MAVASLTYDASLAVEETKSGFFVYDGAPSRFQSSKEEDKYRALSSIVEALRGEAVLVAMDVGMDKLMNEKLTGFDELVKAMTARVFPQAQAEAKELYQVGHKHRGPMSRQAAEPMISYVSRRRRWWATLKKLDSTVDLSPSLLGDLMLDAANLGKVEKLMVLTSTGNDVEFEKVAAALMGQHAKIHVEEKREKRQISISLPSGNLGPGTQTLQKKRLSGIPTMTTITTTEPQLMQCLLMERKTTSVRPSKKLN